MVARLVILLVVVASPVAAQTAIDGDTIKLDGTTWRLWGIDAPEAKQLCADGWPAGVEATRAIERLMAMGSVQCEDRGRDRYGRSIGLCRAAGRDLGAEMVSAGMAWAFTRYSADYVDQEKRAIRGHAGVHAHGCEYAWAWRRRQH